MGGGDNPEIWKAAAMADHFEKIQKLPDLFLEFQISAVFLDTRSTAADSLLLLGWKLLLKKCVAPSTPRMARSSGLMFARSQTSMSMVNQSVLAHQTKLVNMLSLEPLLVTW